jgi:hypothetical protein
MASRVPIGIGIGSLARLNTGDFRGHSDEHRLPWPLQDMRSAATVNAVLAKNTALFANRVLLGLPCQRPKPWHNQGAP